MNKRKSMMAHLLGSVAHHDPFTSRLGLVCFGEEEEGAGAGGGAGGGTAASEELGGGGGGGGGEPWYGSIEDTDLAEYAGKQNFDSPAAAFKKLKNLEGMIGSNDRVALPKEGEDFTAWDGWDKLGAPKEAAAYAEAIKPDQFQLPEGMEWDQGFMDKAFEVAAKARIPVQQIKPLAELLVGQRVEEYNAAREADRKDREAVDQLKTNWGGATDANLELGRRAVKTLFGDKADQVITALSLESGSAVVIEAMAKAGKMMAEGGLVRMDGGEALTPENAQRELASINERMAKGEELSETEMKRRSELYAIAYPGKVA